MSQSNRGGKSNRGVIVTWKLCEGYVLKGKCKVEMRLASTNELDEIELTI